MRKVSGPSLIIMLVMLSTPLTTQAQTSPPPYLQITLDKPFYYPGDSGRLMIDIRDSLSINIQVYNISVIFPWRAYINGLWDGNQTINVNRAVASGAWLPTVTVSFTIPSDSRYFAPGFFSGVGGGEVSVWASGVGPNGGAGTFSQNFSVIPAFYTFTFEWHTITYILIVMTVLVGVMTVSVLYYVYSNVKLRRKSASALPSATSTSMQA